MHGSSPSLTQPGCPWEGSSISILVEWLMAAGNASQPGTVRAKQTGGEENKERK